MPLCETLIIDGRHMLYRTSDAFKDLNAQVGPDDIGTGGMYGFLNLLIRVYRRYNGVVHVAWEGVRSRNFRRGLYPDYKKRPPVEPEMQEFLDDMQAQEVRLKAMLRAMGVRQWAGVDCEADDVIANIASKESRRVIIYTGDSDLRQLVDGRVLVVSPGFRGVDKLYDVEAVKEKHGVKPTLLPDLKALSGDNSDGIPGLRGVGPKTAAILVNAFGGVEKVIKGAQSKDAPWPVAARFKSLVASSADEIRLFRRLTCIDSSRKVREIARKRDKDALRRAFEAYQFRSLLIPSEWIDLWRMGAD